MCAPYVFSFILLAFINHTKQGFHFAISEIHITYFDHLHPLLLCLATHLSSSSPFLKSSHLIPSIIFIVSIKIHVLHKRQNIKPLFVSPLLIMNIMIPNSTTFPRNYGISFIIVSKTPLHVYTTILHSYVYLHLDRVQLFWRNLCSSLLPTFNWASYIFSIRTFLWEFHTMYFCPIHFSFPYYSLNWPTFLSHSVLRLCSPIKANLCWTNILEWIVFHWVCSTYQSIFFFNLY